MRPGVRFRLLIAVLLALALAACEFTLDHELTIHADGSGRFTSVLVYDRQAAAMFSTPDELIEAFEADVAELDGVRVVSTSGDTSDPDAQRVELTAAASDVDALDRLLDDQFNGGSFTRVGTDTYELSLASIDLAAEDAPPGMLDVGGTMTVRHEGERETLRGGVPIDDQAVTWDVFAGEDLRLVLRLEDASTAGVVWWLWGLLALILVVLGGVGVLVLRRRRVAPALPASSTGTLFSATAPPRAPDPPRAATEPTAIPAADEPSPIDRGGDRSAPGSGLS